MLDRARRGRVAAAAQERWRLPPGPRLPPALATAIWIPYDYRLLAALRRRYGDTFSLQMTHELPWVITAEPKLVRAVFAADPATLPVGGATRSLGAIFGSNSPLLLDGPRHRAQRQLLAAHLQGRSLDRYRQRTLELARAEIARWPSGAPLALEGLLKRLVLNLLLEVVFGFAGERLARMRGATLELTRYLSSQRRFALMVYVGLTRARRLAGVRAKLEAVETLLYDELAARRRRPTASNLLDGLALARDGRGEPLPFEELRDISLTVLLAGHESTAATLAWAVERLARYPQVQERLRAALAEGDSRYLRATVQETLRQRPILFTVMRETQAPYELGPYLLPPGIAIVPCSYLVHHRDDLYPEPQRFNPERFLERPPSADGWIPFGGGVHRCAGAPLALAELELVLGELVASRRLEPTRAEPEPIGHHAIARVPARQAEVILKRLGGRRPPATAG